MIDEMSKVYDVVEDVFLTRSVQLSSSVGCSVGRHEIEDVELGKMMENRRSDLKLGYRLEMCMVEIEDGAFLYHFQRST